ncbi:MAG: sulfur carrier protein ThiS [Candidatus Dadabacteria bacterium]|nr:MAG: sulfur carrier protein ThiS [Candidatus Dadabacteria bacterium]
MKVRINGEDRELSEGTTLARLVADLGLSGRRLAIELNRSVVPREQWEETELHEGDRVEIVHFVGGG